MLLGRLAVAIPALLLARRFALQPRRDVTAGALPMETSLAVGILIGAALLVGALT
jgi:K+-transporting ATPase ATPase A chain